MVVRELRWGGLVLGLMLGLGVLALGGNAVAQRIGTYWGDDSCAMCHGSNYDTYNRHGHPWKLVYTGGQTPPDDLYPWGMPLPTLPGIPPDPAIQPPPEPKLATWADVEYILSASKDNEEGASFVFRNGYRDSPGRPGDAKPKSKYSCGSCHTTGYSPDGHQHGLPGITGTWALDGIQCENCHGPKGTMAVSTSTPPVKDCAACHTGSKTDPTTSTPGLPFSLSTMLFSSHGARQSDEFSHSPHKTKTCVLCHDPHRSVWHDDGGVHYSGVTGVGNMCVACHNKRVRGPMAEIPKENGEIGLECVECHMPDASNAGAGATHLFRITTKPVSAAANINTVDANGNGYWNINPTTKDAFLTLDLACGSVACHPNDTVQFLAQKAPYVHRPPGMVDLTVNLRDHFQFLKKTDVVSVDFSVYGDKKTGMNADWWVMCQGPKGWSSWNGTKWVAGKRAWRKGVKLPKEFHQNVLNSKLSPGNYTYWVLIYPKDGSQNASAVPVTVNP
jgi:hypothetical protein